LRYGVLLAIAITFSCKGDVCPGHRERKRYQQGEGGGGASSSSEPRCRAERSRLLPRSVLGAVRGGVQDWWMNAKLALAAPLLMRRWSPE